MTELRLASSLSGTPTTDQTIIQQLQQDFSDGFMQNAANKANVSLAILSLRENREY